jgi:hypothetical protein
MAVRNQLGEAAFVAKIAATTADQLVDMGTNREYFTVVADADSFINFGKPVTATEQMLLKANLVYTFRVKGTTTIHLTASTTSNVYVTAS